LYEPITIKATTHPHATHATHATQLPSNAATQQRSQGI
jgi:hypothetical protein